MEVKRIKRRGAKKVLVEKKVLINKKKPTVDKKIPVLSNSLRDINMSLKKHAIKKTNKSIMEQHSHTKLLELCSMVEVYSHSLQFIKKLDDKLLYGKLRDTLITANKEVLFELRKNRSKVIE